MSGFGQITRKQQWLALLTAVGIVVSVIIFYCCVPFGKQPAVIERSRVDPETGNLIAFWMVRSEGQPTNERVPVLVTHPYALFIQWPSEEYDPDSANQRLFVFYDNVAKKSYLTRDFDVFLDVVSKQPRDITLRQFETCTISRDYMPEAQRGKLEKVLKAGNRTWAVIPERGTNSFLVCYCEFLGDFVFPGEDEGKENSVDALPTKAKKTAHSIFERKLLSYTKPNPKGKTE